MKTNKINKWWTVHCGAYRSFDIFAKNEKNAKSRFNSLYLANEFVFKGFKPEDITGVSLTNRQ